MQLLFQLLCWTESLRQCPLHRCWWTTWTTRSKRRPTCSAQLHLPTHDLFWANVRVQLHLPPLRSLDLLISPGTLRNRVMMMMMSWCLMSSDVIWHIRDKLWPMPKHGSIILYVHGNQKARYDGQPRKSTSTLTQLLNYEKPGDDDELMLNVLRCQLTY